MADMLKDANALKTELAPSAASREAEAINGELLALLGSTAPIQGANAPTTLNAISQWLDKLATAVEGVDGAPTAGAVRSYQIVSAALAAIEPRWRAFSQLARARILPGSRLNEARHGSLLAFQCHQKSK